MSTPARGVSRRALVAGVGAAAGATLVPLRGAAADGDARVPLPRQLPTPASTELAFTHLPPAAFRPVSSTVPWTLGPGTLATTTTSTFSATLTPSTYDLLRELEVYLDAGGQTGAIRLTRYHPLEPRTSEDLVAGTYPPAPGTPLVFHLDHRADPQFWNYVVSIELKPGVTLNGASLWYSPLGAQFVQYTPRRAYDSRLQDGKLASGEDRTISLEGLVGPLPTRAGSALVNVTVDQTEGAGFLTVWTPIGENGSARPATSNINWSADNEILANLAVVKLVGDHDPSFVISAGGPGRTHVIVDVMGVFF